MALLLRLVINAAALFVAALLVPRIYLTPEGHHPTAEAWATLAGVALIFGAVNAVIRPIVIVLTLPLTLLTLGLFTFVVNALMLLLTSGIAQALGLGFHVDGFFPALAGALVVSIVSFALNRLARP